MKSLPSYIPACSLNDPKLDDCVVKAANGAIPTLVNGDPKYRIPNLNPMLIPMLKIEQGTYAVGLNLEWKNADIYGLKDIKMTKSDLDVKTKHARFEFSAPKIKISGLYTASGKVLVLPVTGTGPSNVTVENMKLVFECDWPLKKKANGKEYLDIKNTNLTMLDVGFMSLKFDNLFNGNRLLGDNLNLFINENWKEIAKEIAPAVVDAIGVVFTLLIQRICEIVPYEYVFKP